MSAHGYLAERARQGHVASGPLRAIVFEPAGALYDATPRRRWLWQLATRLGLRLSYDDFIEPWDAEFLPPVHRGECLYADALHSFLASLGLSSADLTELKAAMPLRDQPLETGVRPLPGVARGLSHLSKHGLVFAVLSDCSLPGTELKELLDNLGLGDYFGVVVTSADLGFVKPASHGYRAVSGGLGLRGEACAMVSARAADLAGASSEGWRTISIGTAAGACADLNIATVPQLVEVVSAWAAEKLLAAS